MNLPNAARNDPVPPQNLEAEQAILGAMLLDQRAVEEATEVLSSADFYFDRHRVIFGAMLELAESHKPIDLVSLTETLQALGKLDESGGASYLNELMTVPSTAANAPYYADLVADKAILRSLLRCGSEIQALALNGQLSGADAADRAEELVFGVADQRSRRGLTPVSAYIENVWDSMERASEAGGPAEYLTHLKDLNTQLTSLQPADLIVIAARPSVGKTALAVQIGTHLAKVERKTVAIFSLEMAAEQLVKRMLCSEGQINGQRLNTGDLDDAEVSRLTSAMQTVGQAPIFIDDTSDSSVLEIRGKCRRLKAGSGLHLVIVDYLQLMRSTVRSENRNQEVSAMIRGLKSLARELGVPVVVLSQLSRGSEDRGSRKPLLSDLRDSGAIEAEADVVILIYRKGYHDYKQARAGRSGRGRSDDGDSDLGEPDGALVDDDGTTELIVAKHRNGPTGTVLVTFRKEYAKFSDWAPDSAVGGKGA
ncbi:MAG: replicative DNA helicase [Armatimonadetes bacterium]|nr:replicative DNA helicase [Armatimonadota bacterium]MDE2205866.1 replicative DNA helicase [Armatimonadota bacterium]